MCKYTLTLQAGDTKKRKKRFWTENQKTEFASNLIKDTEFAVKDT
jgi:hypothetical protein